MPETTAVVPTYYLVHETPVGTRYAYPLAGVNLVEHRYQRGSWAAESLTVTDPATALVQTVGDWLISDMPLVELRRERPGHRVEDGLEKRDAPSVEGPVSPDLLAAFEAAPDRPSSADAEHYAEHEAAHACWQCRVYSVTYRTRYVPGEPIVDTQRFDDWRPLPGDVDPDPARPWTVRDSSTLAVYGAHTAHLWPGHLGGLRAAVAEQLQAHRYVVDFHDWHGNSSRDYRGFSITVRVPWETHRRKTTVEKDPRYPRRKAREVTRDDWAISAREMHEVPAGVFGLTKADAIAAFDAAVEREVRRFLPFGMNPRACNHCDGMGWVGGDHA